MDRRLTELRRRARSGDVSAQLSYWIHQIRAGLTSSTYLDMLAMIGDPLATKVSNYKLPRGVSYINGAVKLLQDPKAPKKALYDFYIHILEYTLHQWEKYHPDYRKFKETNQAYIDIFKSLGPGSPPRSEDMKLIISSIFNTFHDRAATRSQLSVQGVSHPPECNTMGELDLMELAFRFLRPIEQQNGRMNSLLEELGIEPIDNNIRWSKHIKLSKLGAFMSEHGGWIGSLNLILPHDDEYYDAGWCSLDFHSFMHRPWESYLIGMIKDLSSSQRSIFPWDYINNHSRSELKQVDREIKFEIIRSFALSKLDN